MSKPTPESLQSVIDDLGSVRDSVRLRAHLLSLETRARWQEIERQLTAAEDTLQRDARDSIAAIGELVESARDFVDRHVKSH